MIKTLQDVADVHYGKRQNEVLDTYGRYPILGTGGVLGMASRPLFKGPGVVVGRKGTLDKPQFIRGDFWTVDTAYAVLPKEGTHTKWLYYMLCAARLEQLSEATGVPSLSRDRLYRVPIRDVNSPEQIRIVHILDAIDDAITKAEAVIAKLKQIRAGLLHDLLTCGLDKNGQLRDPIAHPEQFKDSPLGRIPREWEVDTLVSRITFPEGQVDPRLSPYCDWILVAPDHIETSTGRLIEKRTASQQAAISGKYVFCSRDVIYSKIRPYLRKAILADFGGLCSADMYPLRLNLGVNAVFLLAVVLADPFSKFATAVSMRSGFPKINRVEMMGFKMGWPDSDEQNRMAAVLLAFDAEMNAVEYELKKVQNLKYGLMSDLLTGNVPVPEAMGGQCEIGRSGNHD